MITDKMLNEVAKVTESIPSYMVLGSSDVEVTSGTLVLPGEFERNELDSSVVDEATVKFYGSRSGAVASDDLVSGIGVTIGGSLGSEDLLSGRIISSLLHTSDFDLGFEFWFTFERG